MVTNREIRNQILNPLFDNKFDKNNFINFLKETFPEIDLNQNSLTIPEVYESFIESASELGVYKCGETESSKFLKVFVVNLKESSSLIRARTMQRNFIAKFLKVSSIPSALVAFYNDFSDEWRLSFVKIEKRLVRTENNNLTTETILSPPKRFSFFVGSEKNHTCKSRFLKLIKECETPKIKDIEEVFSVETVTKEFYKEYNKLYEEIKKDLEEVIDNDTTIKVEFDDKNIKSEDFAKKLMGQLVFIYFLQKKGFLGVEKECNWGTGPKDFLKKLFNKEYGEYDNFFNDVIEHLFYDGLSVDTSDYHYSRFGYKVPFLNGGLFDPINSYDWRLTNIKLKDSIFEKIIKTFDQFNFTVKEDEPLEKEVAIDPELLGKVFEDLLSKEEKKKKGIYYTPRHMVQYICQEVLINYLSIHSKVSKEDLKKFIKEGDTVVDCLINNEEDYLTENEFMSSIKRNSEELYLLLSKVKIIDPAVGSGALLVTMMNEIIKARQILLILNDNKDINFYDLKKETIENSLYGVDIEQSSIEITKLRFCLSLIVDEENTDFIRPLPNLNNKITWGNSLVDNFARLFDDSLIVKSSQTRFPIINTERTLNELESKKKEYFKTSSFTNKNLLRNEIKDLKWKFIESYLRDLGKENLAHNINDWEYFGDNAPFFDWELEFSEVFKGENPGFDIVICHPPFGDETPYDIDLTDNKQLKSYIYEIYNQQERTHEKFVSFVQLTYDKLLKNNGELGLIIPKTFTNVSKYTLIRQYVFDHIENVIDCGEAWENVRAEQIILIGNKSEKFDSYYNGTIDDAVSKNEDLEELDKENIDEFEMILNGVKNEEIALAKKIKESNLFLGSVINNQTGGNLQSKACPNEEFDFIGGKQIQREGIVAIQDKVGKENLEPRSYIKDNSVLVQDILSLGKNENLKITACIPYTNALNICNTIRQITPKIFTNFSNYFFWALFNSKLLNWYCHKFIYANAVRTIHFNEHMTNKIPLPSLDNEELYNNIVDKSKVLNEKYQELWSIKEPIFECLRNNIILKEEITNFENYNFDEFYENLKDKQNVTLKKDNRIENTKRFFNTIKFACLEINEKISSLEDDSIESKNILCQELQSVKEPMFDYLKDKVTHNIKTNEKTKNFEKYDYNVFIHQLSKQNIDIESITNLEDFFNNVKDSCLEIDEEINSLEEELGDMIYELYDLSKGEIEIIEDYFSSANEN